MAHTSGKHIKKKKAAPGSRMVLVFGGIALLYFLAQVISALSGGVSTVSATRATVDDAITATGCFIRSETVIAGAKGETVEHVAHGGEKVYTGARLAVEYADASALAANRQMQALSEQIALVQSALQSVGNLADTAKLDQLISVQMQTLARQTHDGMVTGLASDASQLRQLVLRRVAGGQDEQALQEDLQALQAQKSALAQSVSARTNVISSPAAGYFSETTDGYESVLTAADIDRLTVTSFRSKLAQPVQQSGAALGKIMHGFEWYFAAVVPSTDAEGMKAGRDYALRFSQVSQDVTATLYAARPEGDETLLIFKSSVISSELLSMRQQVVDIVRGTYSGIKVPKSAIRTDGDVMGVFTLSGSVSRFKPITPLYEGDTYYVIAQGNTADTGVVVQDNIIVKARGLEDKKVVK